MRRWWVLVVVAALGACGDDDGGAASSPSTSGATTATAGGDAEATTSSGGSAGGAGTTTVVVTTTRPDGDATGSVEVESASGTRDEGGEVTRVRFEELYQRRGELVGATVEVDGTVHFVSRCPPPPPEGGRPEECELVGYLAEEGRSFLAAGDIGRAIPLAEGGSPLVCPQQASTGGACPGWEQGGSYRLVGTVQRRPGSGSGNDVQFDVESKTPR